MIRFRADWVFGAILSPDLLFGCILLLSLYDYLLLKHFLFCLFKQSCQLVLCVVSFPVLPLLSVYGNVLPQAAKASSISKTLFPAHVKEMHKQRDKGFEKEFSVSQFSIFCALQNALVNS